MVVMISKKFVISDSDNSLFDYLNCDSGIAICSALFIDFMEYYDLAV